MFLELLKLRELNKLKSTYRRTKIGDRHESDAEHSWGCIFLADYFTREMKLKLDKAKVYELLLYHDAAEINIGDVPIVKKETMKNREKEERDNLANICKELPTSFGQHILNTYEEFEKHATREAKFAKCIDCIETLFFGIENTPEYYWKGWTDTVTRKIYAKRFEEFPELKPLFEEMLKWLENNGYFEK